MKNNPFNFFKYLKKYGWKKTIDDWKKNYYLLDSPLQVIKRQLIGYIIATLGILLVLVKFIVSKDWLYMVAIIGTLIIFYSQMEGLIKQYHQIKKIEEQYKEGENNGL